MESDMSKSAKSAKPAVNLIRVYSEDQIADHVATVNLPVELQGIEGWQGSKEVGGNPASHLASVNGKSRQIGLCQIFSDFWFGAESRVNLTKGIKHHATRKAWDAATINVDRVNGELKAETMLSFLRDFEAAKMRAEVTTPEKLAEKAEGNVDAKNESEGESESNDVDVDMVLIQNHNQAAIIAAQAQRIEELERALAKAQETISAASVAKSVKAVRELLAA